MVTGGDGGGELGGGVEGLGGGGLGGGGEGLGGGGLGGGGLGVHMSVSMEHVCACVMVGRSATIVHFHL